MGRGNKHGARPAGAIGNGDGTAPGNRCPDASKGYSPGHAPYIGVYTLYAVSLPVSDPALWATRTEQGPWKAPGCDGGG